jgi:hypothetical protein
MGPSAESLSIADFILASHPEIRVDRIELAYTIMAWVEREDAREQEQP